MADFTTLIKGAKLAEDEVPICLRGDLTRRFEALERQLEEAQDGDEENSMAAGGRALEIAEEMEAVRAEMLEHTHPFAFRALPKQEYRDLLDKHPPREDHKDDVVMGANLHTFPHVLIQACCIDPVMTLEQVEELCEVLNDGQLYRLFGCALTLNRATVDIPKSVLASEILAKQGPKSKPPAPGASPADGSSAGSPAG